MSRHLGQGRDLEGGHRAVASPGAELVNPTDGMVLICIPAGTYTLGDDDGHDDEMPVHQVTLQAYALGKTAVTNAQYRRFLEATHQETEGDWAFYATKWGEQAPVVCVSWNDATAYCQWAGLRLPTEAEWEAAARGPQAHIYPWGDTWDPSLCRNSEDRGGDPIESPVAVGSYPQGASPFGCLDMAGNVWEWCSSKYQPYPYDSTDGREASTGPENRVLRGGSWDDFGEDHFRGAVRDASQPTYGENFWGFRAAKSL